MKSTSNSALHVKGIVAEKKKGFFLYMILINETQKVNNLRTETP